MSGRYSGMRDKHGIDIAEGDILQRDEDDLEFVKTIAIFWSDEEAGWKYRFRANPGEYIEGLANAEYCSLFEIIGNIDENPELLEVES